MTTKCQARTCWNLLCAVWLVICGSWAVADSFGYGVFMNTSLDIGFILTGPAGWLFFFMRDYIPVWFLPLMFMLQWMAVYVAGRLVLARWAGLPSDIPAIFFILLGLILSGSALMNWGCLIAARVRQ